MKITNMDRLSSQASYLWGGICIFFGAVDWNLVAIIIGIILSIATFLMNRHYRKKQDARADRESEAKIKYYQSQQKELVDYEHKTKK